VLVIALTAIVCSCDGSASAPGALVPRVQSTTETTSPTNADQSISTTSSQTTTTAAGNDAADTDVAVQPQKPENPGNVIPANPSAEPDTTTDSATSNPPAASSNASPSGAAPSVSTPSTTKPESADAVERDCTPRPLKDFRALGTNAASLSIQLSMAMFDCADEVAFAPQGDSAAIATLSAARVKGPLMLAEYWRDSPVLKELQRLAPNRVVTAGVHPQIIDEHLSEFEVEVLPVDLQATPAAPDPAAELVWLVDEQGPVAALAALAAQVEATVVPTGDDLRALSKESKAVLAAASDVESLTNFGDDLDWQLAVVKKGLELPGGGQLLFDPDQPRRIVAMYGHPVTAGLGVLGEQSPEEGIERLKSISADYDADGATVLPAFEIIATVASASAGADGDYSATTNPDVIRPWVETAAANDAYVVMDLQPGRSSFVQQLEKYEEFLKLPHVGLALDPEWRLAPNQLHLRQIGRVHADEINQVIDWLAELVRRESLPQKLLIIHQFRHSMITEREHVQTPAELAVMIHMDGQGSLGAKYNTWRSLTTRPDAEQFYWGWKNFYDEDSPVATAEQVLALEPKVWFVSFQ